MKKLYIVITSILISLFFIIFINQLLKLLVALALGYHSILEYSVISSNVILFNPASISTFKYFFIMSVPLLSSIIFIETTFIWLAKTQNEHLRSGLIIFQLTNIGYLLYAVFLGIFTILFKSKFSNDWNSIFSLSGLSYYQNLLVLFLLIILLLGYINILTKRVKRIIPVIK